MRRLSEKEKKDNPNLIYDNYTNIYSNTILKYNAIKLYTFKSLRNTMKEYDVFVDRWISTFDDFKCVFDDESQEGQALVLAENIKKIRNKLKQSHYLISVIPSNLIVSLISSFDQFLSDIINYIFIEVPNQLNIIKETASIEELSNCNDQNMVQDYFIEKFLDNFFRKSHGEQIAWFDDKLSMQMKKNMPRYDDFIFLCELRNIIVHNDGKPNKYFFNNVKDVEKYNKIGFKIENGKQIELTLDNIYYVICVIQVVTTYIYAAISQKYYKRDAAMMDHVEEVINENIVEKLRREPELSRELIETISSKEFAHSAAYEYIYKVNKCITYRNQNNKDAIIQILDSMDWTNCGSEFKFAKYVLLEQKDMILKYMKMFTTASWKCNYQVWPLFDKLREEEYFKEEYKQIFQEEFEYQPANIGITPDDLRQIEEKIRNQKKEN